MSRTKEIPANQGFKTLLIGIGNEYRQDDAAGLVAARRLKGKENAAFKVIEESGEGSGLMESWKGWDRVILVDAVQSGGASGEIHRFDAKAQAIPARFFRASTHAFSVAQAVELGRALDVQKGLPRRPALGRHGDAFLPP